MSTPGTIVSSLSTPKVGRVSCRSAAAARSYGALSSDSSSRIRSTTSHAPGAYSSTGSALARRRGMDTRCVMAMQGGRPTLRSPVALSPACNGTPPCGFSTSWQPHPSIRTAASATGQPRCCSSAACDELCVPCAMPRLATARPDLVDASEAGELCDPWTAAAETCDPQLGWCRGPIPSCHSDLLGCGSFGKVYLAERPADSDPPELLAVKAVDKTCEPQTGESNLGTRKRVAASLRREAEILEKMQGGPNVVELKGLFEDERYAYIAMEVCDRGDLQQLMDAQDGVVPEAAVRCLARQMLMAIDHAHSQGICYSDVKPANFLLKSCDDDDTDGPGSLLGLNVKLADFGCSQDLDDEEYLTARTGTPLYTAPEVYLGRYGLEADIWGIGMILYRLLAGMFPFRRNLDSVKPFSMMMSVMHDELQFDENVWAGISPEALDLVTSMLYRSASKRISAADALQHPWFAVDLPETAAADAPASGPLSNSIEPFARRTHDLEQPTDTV